MFKFNKNAELLDTIEKQKSQLNRYENRLRDLVTAYKSLQNEKQALEASVKALSSSHASPSLGRKLKSNLGGSKLSVSSVESSRRSSVDVTKQSSSVVFDTEEKTGDSEEEKDDDDASQKEEDDGDDKLNCKSSDQDVADDEFEKLQHQIATLTLSLSTVTQEKSRIVATYQAEKRKIKHETDEQLSEITEELENLKIKHQESAEELCLAKDKIRSQQEDREQEQSTHSIMLRELQKMLNDERTKNEQLTEDLQDARKTAQKATSESKKSENNEKDLKKLMQELEIAYDKLKLAKEEAKKPQPIVAKLQKEIAEIKASHRVQLEKERMRFVSTENRLKIIEKEAEERVASLENQITELSNQMGGYERNKTKDQELVRKLKERIGQVEAENGVLAKRAAAASNRSEELGNMDDADMDIEDLQEQIIKYKGLLKIAVQKSNNPLDVSGWMSGIDDKSDEIEYQKLYFDSQQELQQIKDEFEKYKVRAQNVLKSKRETGIGSRDSNAPNTFTQQQFQELKNQLEEVRERHFHLRSHCDGLEEQQNKMIKEHGEELLTLHLSHQKQLDSEKENYSAKVLDLEQEMRSQRERTVALLAEKDKEIQSLQAYSTACHREYQTEYSGGMVDHNQRTSTSSDKTFYGQDKIKETSTSDSVTEIMNQGSMHDTTMIHYAEQMARKDVSINGLRRHKKQLELQIRQLQDVIMTKDEKNSREIAELQEKIASFDRSKSRENANLEYLKNVMFQYLTTDKDQSAKNRMLTAVTAILQFSPEEIKRVRKKF